MLTAEKPAFVSPEISADAVREQVELLVTDPVFRSSKRSIEFLKYVVRLTLDGNADQIKERTIGVEVFGRPTSYDTNSDHVVRTAAIELRKRLAIYYGQEQHRAELCISLVPGSYIPRFTLGEPHSTADPEPPAQAAPTEPASAPSEPIPVVRGGFWTRARGWTVGGILAVAAAAAFASLHRATPQDLFWKPLLDTPGSVLLAVGYVPNGPPTALVPTSDPASGLPLLQKALSPTVPFGDAATMARVYGLLQEHGKGVIVRQQGASTFSELRESPVVMIGAFNNEWSLRLTRTLRYSLALDPDRHLIYIRDAKNPANRSWSWGTDQPKEDQGGAGRPPLQDFALISRIRNSNTGHPVVVIGGLYTYGTEAAGELLADPQMMHAIPKADLENSQGNLQIVIATTVTDGTAGPPHILAIAKD
jgi:hypothetical protein